MNIQKSLNCIHALKKNYFWVQLSRLRFLSGQLCQLKCLESLMEKATALVRNLKHGSLIHEETYVSMVKNMNKDFFLLNFKKSAN